MKINIIPLLKDNYGYVLVDDETKECAVVDPGEAEPILRFLESEGLRLQTVLCTHRHGDHVAGLPKLLIRFPELRVYAHSSDVERIQGVTDGLDDGDRITVCGQEAEILYVPCHTSGDINYFFAEQQVLFSGDTLFVGTHRFSCPGDLK